MKYYIGIDLGGTNIVTGIVDENHQIVTKYSTKSDGSRSFEEIVRSIADSVFAVMEKGKMQMAQIESVGMGTPSCINPHTGLLVHANCFDWHNVPLYDELKKYIEKPLFIRNDADCAALGETLAGAARAYNHAIMLTLGTGVGGGVIIDNKIFNGCDHMGAELGHTKLVYNGIQCTCGQYGCLESYASATALINQTREMIKMHPESQMNTLVDGDLLKVNGKIPFDAAALGDKWAVSVIDQYIDYLAAGISTLIVIFRPEVIILGGGISEQDEILLVPLNEKIKKHTFGAKEIGVPPAIKARLGNDAGVIGAAMLGSI